MKVVSVVLDLKTIQKIMKSLEEKSNPNLDVRKKNPFHIRVKKKFNPFDIHNNYQ